MCFLGACQLCFIKKENNKQRNHRIVQPSFRKERGLSYFLVREFFGRGARKQIFFENGFPARFLNFKRHSSTDGFGFGNPSEFFEHVDGGIGIASAQARLLREVFDGER